MPVRQERRGVPDIHFIMYESDGSRNLSKDSRRFNLREADWHSEKILAE